MPTTKTNSRLVLVWFPVSCCILFLLKCAEQLPHKIPFCGTLVGLLNLEDEDFVRKIVENTRSNLQMCSKVLRPRSLVVLFEALLSSSATTVDEDKGNSSWQACPDFYVYCILSCLPWGGAELVEQVPEEIDRVVLEIQAYMSIRKHVSGSGCFAFEHIDDRSHSNGGKDFLEDLWSRPRDGSWIVFLGHTFLLNVSWLLENLMTLAP